MLELVRDCFCFVTSYFEAISASSSHIYHSALVLAPKKSIVWGLYRSYAHPFVRVVCGLPMSWDASTVAITRLDTIKLPIWSPCNRFIAFTCTTIVEILDSVTFQQLQALELPQGVTSTDVGALAFSPDSHIITLSGGNKDQGGFLISWDLQTGGIVSTTRHQSDGSRYTLSHPSITYSADGMIVGVCGEAAPSYSTLCIFDVASGMQMHSHLLHIDVYQRPSEIWTYAEYVRFANLDVRAITIWEVGFTSDSPPTEVKTILIQESLDGCQLSYYQVLSTPFRLILCYKDDILVIDPQYSTSPLHCTDFESPSFSSDGHFLASSTSRSEVHLWKGSPTGYILYTKIATGVVHPKSLLSPNGDLIITYGSHMIQLWHTKGLTIPPSSGSAKDPQNANFILDFSTDGALAVVARREDSTVTIINLSSGISQLSINVDTRVYCLQVIKDAVVVVDNWKVVAWNLHTGDYIPDARVGLENTCWEEFYFLPKHVSARQLYPPFYGWFFISISPDFHHIIAFKPGSPWTLMSIYSASTGAHLIDTYTPGEMPWFSPDGHKIWSVRDDGTAYVQRTDSVWDGGNTIVQTSKLGDIQQSPWHSYDGKRFGVDNPPEGFPWASSHGYWVTNDWWVLAPDRRRLFMLPPPWRSKTILRVWKGQFLALLHGGLSEPVILELSEVKL